MSFFNFFKTKSSSITPSPIWEEYLQFFKTPENQKIPFRQARFVVLDTETSGLNPKSDKVLSIAALSIENFRLDVGNRFECYIEHSNYQPGEEVQVHGILASQLQNGIDERAALESFLPFVKDSIIVGHHIAFDIAILNEKLKAHFGNKLRNKKLDTALMARRLENPLGNQHHINRPASLDSLCQKYNIPLGKRHTAAGDAFITAILFMKLLSRFEKKKVTMLRDLLKT